MNPLTEQRALIALDLLLGRGISMTRATKLARTTPKTLKGYLAAKGIKWIIKNRRFEIVRTPQQMVKLGEDALIKHIRTIGLYRTKAKNIISLSKKLIEEHGSEVPDDRSALVGLAGVGRKTANVVLNIAFGRPTMAVDTHIFRVANRTGLAPGKNVDAVEKAFLYLFHPFSTLNSY